MKYYNSNILLQLFHYVLLFHFNISFLCFHFSTCISMNLPFNKCFLCCLDGKHSDFAFKSTENKSYIIHLFIRYSVCYYKCISVSSSALSAPLKLLQCAHPVHHRHQIESGMSADVVQTIFTASLKRTAVFI